ncbi:uncharacterized protein LOC112153312 [Oryzias melastigma]|uniref:uncharacterized protein LOC112153312 n=1 Tax=Oryzias melastigma TaxID=30732 RepID=UPI000CF7E6EC|nr:uncharacterized protein LOC112153312 [Oryzias melastigma]
MFLTLFTVFYVLFGSSCGLREKEMCIGGSVEIDMYTYISYAGPLYFYPREGGVMKTLMNNRQPMDERLIINTKSVKLTKLTEKDNGKFAIVKIDGVVSDILSLTVNDCPEKILLFTGQELVRNVPSNAYYLHVTYSQSPDHSQLLWDHRNGDYGRRGRVSGNVLRISEVTHKDNGEYNFRDEKTSMVLQIQLDVRESHPIITYIIVAVVAVLLVPICYCCCCKKCCCKNKKPPSEVAQTAAEPKVFYHDSTQLEGSGFSAAPSPAAFPPPTGSAAFPPPAGSAAFPPPAGSAAFPPPAGSAAFPPSAGNVHFPPPAGSAAFRPPAGIPAFPPPEGNAGIPYDAAASSTGPVPYQPTYEIKNIFQPKVAPGASEKSASFNYNPLSSDYQPMFEVKGKSYNFDLPLSTENSSAEVYKSDKMNFL